MSQVGRGSGKDVCGRVHAVIGSECYLPDAHYPWPHQSVEGESWHDGLCSKCAGSGSHDGSTCDRCNGAAFEPIEPIDPNTYKA